MVPSHRHEDRSSVPKTHIKVGVGMVGTFVISMLKKRDWRIPRACWPDRLQLRQPHPGSVRDSSSNQGRRVKGTAYG